MGCLGALAVIVASIVGVAGFLAWQGQRKPTGNPQYVALGSSFAAGLGLGARVPGSPIVCQRSGEGYPSHLARILGLSLVDMSCSGATTSHVLHGGQVFQGRQIDAISRETQLVTLTSGGNDISYVGDLTFLAMQRSSGLTGWAMRHFWSGPKTMADRKFAKVRADLVETLRQIRRRAPSAKIVLVSYPSILPPEGACDKLQLDVGEVEMMRAVGERLAAETRAAAAAEGAIFVDAQSAGAKHHACSDAPWVNGWRDPKGAPFHPNSEGAKAVATLIAAALAG